MFFDIPSLIRERVIIQPLVRQHASQKDQAEGRVSLNDIPIRPEMSFSKQLGTEAHFFPVLRSQADGAEEYRQTYDVPQCQEDGGGLQKRREQHRVGRSREMAGRSSRIFLGESTGR